MKASVRARFWLEAGLASAGAFFAAVTAFWRDWIEAMTGLDPDHHSGGLEWAIAFGFVALALVAGSAAWNELRGMASVAR